MAVLPIRTTGDPVLRQKARRVKAIDSSIERLIDDMIDTMRATSGAGLAASQVGQLLRVIVAWVPEEEEPIALINPEVVKRSEESEVVEGCLSVPGYRGDITRSLSVTVKGRNRQGKEVRIKAQGLLAQVLQHEIDHLDGVLYIDHVEDANKLYSIEPVEGESAGL